MECIIWLEMFEKQRVNMTSYTGRPQDVIDTCSLFPLLTKLEYLNLVKNNLVSKDRIAQGLSEDSSCPSF